MSESRILVLLHPNTSMMECIMNDRMFNKEKYTFTREIPPNDVEEKMLCVLNQCTNGIVKAACARNKMSIEIEDGFYLSEIIPSIIIAIKHFVNEKDYNPVIYVDDRRYIEDPVYAPSTGEWDIGREISPGVKAEPGTVNIGVDYIVWER